MSDLEERLQNSCLEGGGCGECMSCLCLDRIATLEAELREVRSDFAALQKALVGDTGRSAILEAERLRGIEKGDLVEPRGCAMPGACAALERIAGLKARVTKLEAENARPRRPTGDDR